VLLSVLLFLFSYSINILLVEEGEVSQRRIPDTADAMMVMLEVVRY